MADDPFEILRKKLAQKKKSKGSLSARPERKVTKGPGLRRVVDEDEKKKTGSPLAGRGPSTGSAPRKPVPARSTPPRQGSDPTAPPKGLIKKPWAKEDIVKMKTSKAKVADETPVKFTSHRYDNTIEADRKGRKQDGKDKNKDEKKPPPKPKGFVSGRYDR